MMGKTSNRVLIRFANNDPELQTKEHYKDVWDAVDDAALNLDYRHHIKVKKIKIHAYGVVIDLYIPNDIVSNFSYGPHLKGVTNSLLKKNPCYGDFRIGKRLLTYTELIPSTKHVTTEVEEKQSSCKYCMPDNEPLDGYNTIWRKDYKLLDRHIAIGLDLDGDGYSEGGASLYFCIEDMDRDDLIYSDKVIKIKYCPFCGRKLVSDRVKENE